MRFGRTFVDVMHCKQGPSLLKNFEGENLIVCVSMTSPGSPNRSTTFL